jgi:hypothetical protein
VRQKKSKTDKRNRGGDVEQIERTLKLDVVSIFEKLDNQNDEYDSSQARFEIFQRFNLENSAGRRG